MTKLEIAEILVKNPVWEGIQNPKKLAKMYSKEELKDTYRELNEAEEEYYNNKYN